MIYYTIYKTTNVVNDKIYIGKHQTLNLGDGYLGSGKILLRAVNKYGKDKFISEILYIFDSIEEMDDMERKIVDDEFISRKDTYNLTIGGQGGFHYINKKGLNTYNGGGASGGIAYGKRLKEDLIFKEKISKEKSIQTRKRYRETKIVCTFKDKKHTEESKRKIGRANAIHQKGKNNSSYGTCWIYSESSGESTKIKKEDLAIWLEKGWVKGRKMKNKCSSVAD